MLFETTRHVFAQPDVVPARLVAQKVDPVRHAGKTGGNALKLRPEKGGIARSAGLPDGVAKKKARMELSVQAGLKLGAGAGSRRRGTSDPAGAGL